MALSIHTNYSALVTQTSLNKTNNALTTVQQRLGTGFRINSAADDAAGLQIAARLNAQSRGLMVAMRNAQDGISMLQTAEGALDEMTNIVVRMRELALQSANGTNDTSERTALDAEYQQLKSELQNILENTYYGSDKNLFDGTFDAGSVALQIGTASGQTLGVDVSSAVTSLSTAHSNIQDITSDTNATTELDTLDTMLDAITAARGAFGAYINRLNHTINNLSNMRDNTVSAHGRIMDADFAAESANLAKQSMLLQSGISMLKQTSQMPSVVMSLLG